MVGGYSSIFFDSIFENIEDNRIEWKKIEENYRKSKETKENRRIDQFQLRGPASYIILMKFIDFFDFFESLENSQKKRRGKSKKIEENSRKNCRIDRFCLKGAYIIYSCDDFH